MKKMKRYAKIAFCVALSVAMMFTDTGITAFAEESTQSEKIQQKVDLEEAEAGETVILTEEERAEEVFVGGETAEQMSEEWVIEEKTEESALTEKSFDEDNVMKKQTEYENLQDASSEEDLMEKTETGIASNEETISEDSTDMEETVTEIKTESRESENELTFSDTDIDHGEYKKNGNDITWVINADGKLTVEGTGDFAESGGYSRVPWYNNCYQIKTAEINVKGMTDASYMFYECRNLASIDVSRFDTVNMTHMDSMFENCYNLTKVDMSSFDTRNVTDMSGMFYWCRSLTSLDVSSFDTGNVTDMSFMFWGCENLTSLDVSGFDTGNVTDMLGMFYQCMSLTSLDVSSFDTRNVTDMSSMFCGCYGLASLNVSSFNTGNVTDMSSMFKNLKLKSLDVSSFETKNVMYMRSMFENCYSLESVNVSGFDTRNVTNMSSMFRNCDSLINVDISNFNTGNVTDMSFMFSHCYGRLTSLDVSGFDTGNVTDMSHMFMSCEKLTNLDVSGFDTANVTDISAMFYHCESLTSLDVSGFDTRNVTDMSHMFCGCENLARVDVSDFNTKNVTDMSWMFGQCYSLTNLDLSSFDTRNVTNMSGIFDYCIRLTSLDISGFDTGNVTDMSCMFTGLKLASLDVSGLYTGNVTDMSRMFMNCDNLESLNVSGFDTRNVTRMYEMFLGCDSLIHLDLSSFDMSEVTDSDSLFYGFQPAEMGMDAIKTMYAPYNLKSSETIKLPKSGAKDLAGNVYDNLPTDLEQSILLYWGSKEEIMVPAHITAKKKKTSYLCGETIDVNDITVVYYRTDGMAKTLAQSEYTSNEGEIDMSSAGIKTLTVFYTPSDILENEQPLIAKISLCVEIMPTEKKEVKISGIEIKDSIYSKTPVSCTGTAKVSLEMDNTDLTDIVKLDYTYSGIQADGSAYIATSNAPVNAGEYTLIVAVATDDINYAGSAEYSFKIIKAPLTVMAHDMELEIGAELPEVKDYQYVTSGLLEGDRLTKEPSLACNIIDTAKAGTYDITVFDADAGMNYEITYQNGTLTITETEESSSIESSRMEESIQFNASEESSEIEESTISEESSEIEESSIFEESSVMEEGSSTEENSSTEESSTEDKDDSPYADSERTDLKSVGTIAEIKVKAYDGNAYEPAIKVVVKADGKKITLTEGADYRILYKNNINAGIGTVIIRGNGVYKGEIRKPLIITQKPINKLKIITGSIVGTAGILKLPIYVYDGTKLLQRGKDYTLSDYKAVKDTMAQVTVNAVQNGNYIGSTVVKLTVYESGANIINPANVKLKEASMPYTGKAVKPEVTVTVNGATLTNRNYKVKYQNNKNAGTAYVIVTGKGTYKGKAVIPFTIKAETVVNANDFTIKEIKAKTYNGKLQKPAVSVTIQKNGKTRKLSKKDYIVTYKDNLHAGEATIIVTGKGNYAGLSATAKFTITPQQIKKASLKGTQGNLVLMYNKRKLREGTDYDKPEYGPINKNKVLVTIKGKGDFAGEITKTVKLQ